MKIAVYSCLDKGTERLFPYLKFTAIEREVLGERADIIGSIPGGLKIKSNPDGRYKLKKTKEGASLAVNALYFGNFVPKYAINPSKAKVRIDKDDKALVVSPFSFDARMKRETRRIGIRRPRTPIKEKQLNELELFIQGIKDINRLAVNLNACLYVRKGILHAKLIHTVEI